MPDELGPPAGGARLLLDRSARVVDGGRALLGGSPLKLFRLTEHGARLVEQIRAGADLGTGHAALTDRLLDAGVVHPIPAPGTGPSVDDVTLVVPAHDVPPERLVALIAASGVRRTIVVDDASRSPVDPPAGAEVVRLDLNRGPAGARNAGLVEVRTPLVAFLDADTEPVDGWLDVLLPHFADERVGLVAPRTMSTPGPSTLARYEQWRSPLDLGPEPARVRAGTRVSYVPAAAMVARAAAVHGIGGFDERLRYGEDVDLVWRLDEAGWRVRYDPRSVVHHQPRSGRGAWARQRAGYGSAAALLERLHPGAVTPVRMNRWSLAAWATGVVSPVAGVAIAGATTVALARKLRNVDQPWHLAGRLAGLGHLYAGRILASAMTRTWLPFALAAALVSRRARRILVASAIVPPVVDWVRDRPDVDLPRAVALRVTDDVAYGTGVWRGIRRERSLAAIRPRLSPD